MSDGAPQVVSAATPAAAGTSATPAATPVTPVATPAVKEPVVVPAKTNPSTTGTMIPKHRLDEVSGKLKTAEAELEKLRALKPDELQTSLSRTQSLLEFARAGVLDEEHAAAVNDAYGKLPAEGKPASAVEYWKAIQAGTVQAPRTLVGFMPAAATPASTPAGTPVAPRLPTAPASTPAATPTVTVQQVQQLQDRFRANPTDAGLRKQMLEATAALAAQNKA